MTRSGPSARGATVTLALALLVAALAIASLGVGPVRLSPLTVIEALIGRGGEIEQIIVQQIRLPRAILAVAIGGIERCCRARRSRPNSLCGRTARRWSRCGACNNAEGADSQRSLSKSPHNTYLDDIAEELRSIHGLGPTAALC